MLMKRAERRIKDQKKGVIKVEELEKDLEAQG